ncbi:MAG: hypothetical protein JW846_00845 [Dehalococcoidia bacterium]|nr:hypothetical protein [Dehalococcoidia bacterium]
MTVVLDALCGVDYTSDQRHGKTVMDVERNHRWMVRSAARGRGFRLRRADRGGKGESE